MKIAHVCTRFSPADHPGGVERVVQELAERQASEHEVEVLCRDEFDDRAEQEYDGFTVRRAAVHDRKYLRTLSSITSMRRLIRDSDADVYHVHDWSPFLPYLAAGRPGRSVLTFHNDHGDKQWLKSFLIARADAVTAVTQELARRMNQDYDGAVQVIHDGADSERFTPSEPEGHALFVGRLTENKGALETAIAAKALDIPLRMIGKGPLRPQIEAENPSATLLGEIPHERVSEEMGRCSWFLLPSRTEGFGLVWAEALMSGKPILCTDTGVGASIPEQCGVRISTDHTQEQLEHGLQALTDQDWDRDAIRTWAIQAFDWDGIMEEYMEVYQG